MKLPFNIDLKDFNENYNTDQEVLYEQTLYSYVIKKQLLKEEIPVGAVIVKNNKIIDTIFFILVGVVCRFDHG